MSVEAMIEPELVVVVEVVLRHGLVVTAAGVTSASVAQAVAP